MITVEQTSDWLDLGIKYSQCNAECNGKEGFLVKDNETGRYSFDYYYKKPFQEPEGVPEELVEMARDIWENKPSELVSIPLDTRSINVVDIRNEEK